MSAAQSARHEIVVEVYDGIAIGMRCCTCHERIPIRPERAAITVAEVNYLATQHQSAVAAIDVMRGAADDGAHDSRCERQHENGYCFCAQRAAAFRAAVGAPASGRP